MSKSSAEAAGYVEEIDRLKKALEKCTLEKQQLQSQVDAIRHIVSVGHRSPSHTTRSSNLPVAKVGASTPDPASASTPSKGQSKKKKNRSKKPKSSSQLSLLSLPAELIDEIVWHLTLIHDMQYIGVKTPWQGDKFLDSWNKDVDNLSKTCRSLRESLVVRHKKRVITIEDDFTDLQAKVDKIPLQNRAAAT
jgi:hypothetical protein